MKDIQYYLENYEKYGIIRDKANVEGDYKANNSAYKKMNKIIEWAMNNDKRNEFFITVLQTSNSPSALISCCSQMMKLDFQLHIARDKLVEISNNKSIPSILSFNAEMFLQEWDKGNIKPIE